MTDLRMTEDMLQVYTADLLRAFAVPGVIWFHVPNQNMAAVQYRVKLKKYGLRAGVSDFVFVRLDMRAAFVELKDDKGRQTQDQIQFEKDCQAIDVPYFIARTPEQVDGILSALGIIKKDSRRVSTSTGRLENAGVANAGQPPHQSSVTQPAARSGASCGTGAAPVKRRRSRVLSEARQ